MTLAKALALAALVLADPTGDAIGDGTLTAPTAPIYASSAIFDLHEVDVAGDESGTTVRVTLGAIENAAGLPEGFSGVVIDVYLDTAPEGAETTLDGPNMRMPEGRGWQYAIRISGDGAYAVADTERAEGAARALPGAPASVGNAGAAEAAEAEGEAAPEALGRVPLTIARDGSTLSVRLPWVVEDRFEVYAMTGVYDPFTPSGWRPLSTTPSPWAFSGSEQIVPVVDLLAPDAATQERALRSGVLPRPETRAGSTSWWLLLMALGLALAGAGLWFRRRVRPQEVEAAVPAPETEGEATSDSATDMISDMPTDTAPSAPSDSVRSDSDAVSGMASDSASSTRSDTASASTSETPETVRGGLGNAEDGPPADEHRDAVPETDLPAPEPVVGETGRARRLQVVLTEEGGPDARTPPPEPSGRTPPPEPYGRTPAPDTDGRTPAEEAAARTPATEPDTSVVAGDASAVAGDASDLADDTSDLADDASSLADDASDVTGRPPDDPFAGFFDDDEPGENDDIDEFGRSEHGGAGERGRRDGRG